MIAMDRRKRAEHLLRDIGDAIQRYSSASGRTKMARRNFHIHGDNIVECERVFSLIRTAHEPGYSCVGPTGNPSTPRFLLKNDIDEMEFILFPGYGRWDENVLRFITDVAGTLREASDCIITSVDGVNERALVAIEYCSALDAGNNAWQRCGRAYSFAKAGIPYFYLTDIGGYELDGNRGQKFRRYPNPAVPFSFVALSHRAGVCALPVYACNPSADEAFRVHFASVFDEALLKRLLCSIVHGKSTLQIEDDLREKAILFSELIQSRPDKSTTSQPDFLPKLAYKALSKKRGLIDYMLEGNAFPWRKSITIPLSTTAKRFLQLGSEYGVGISRSPLPICVVFSERRKSIANEIKGLYSDLPTEVSSWLDSKNDLVICWIAGFKPRGDDSRPDRGLVPLARMLFGNEVDVLSFIYGPAKDEMWRTLRSNPQGLIQKNGLWEAVCKLSDCVFLDSPTNKGITARAYLRSHWDAKQKAMVARVRAVGDTPLKYGENDVDTVLHCLFAYLINASVFEGMCNPPGGDWSGISILDNEKRTESRWLTLPRVSGSATKRPDHVLQFFYSSKIVIVAVESKELAQRMEPGIGPRLKKYLTTLFSTPPNVRRAHPNGSWQPYSGQRFKIQMEIATAVAFMSSSEAEIKGVLQTSQADFALAVEFTGSTCQIRGIAGSSLGELILSTIKEAVKKGYSQYKWVD